MSTSEANQTASTPVLSSGGRLKKYTCPVNSCPKAYTRPSLLVEHMHSHNNVRPFACEFCDKRFLKQTHLKSHRWIHTERRPLGCTLCERRFITKQQLQRHLRAHQKKKPSEEDNWREKEQETSIQYAWKIMNTEKYKVAVSQTSLTPPQDFTSHERSSSEGTFHDVLKCPHGCHGSHDSTKSIISMKEHINTDTIDTATHLTNLKVDMARSKGEHSLYRIIGWNGENWTEKRCMEVGCQSPSLKYLDLESLILHYNNYHGFVPGSLLSFLSMLSVEAETSQPDGFL